MVLLTKVLFVFLSIYGINSFNISPNPNIIVNEPLQNVKTSTYFGYAINLRKNSILIGAPKYTKDKKINETGVIYKCEISELNATNCYPYEFHRNNNVKFSESSPFAYLKSEINEYQMLGSTMDGFGSETDKFVTCAPNFKNFLSYINSKNQTIEEYQLNGACFMIQNSEKSVTENVKNIILTSAKKNQKYGPSGKSVSHHRYSQQGFSVHFTEHSSEIIMGAPGIFLWSGMLIFSHNLIWNKHSFVHSRINYSLWGTTRF